MSDFLNNLAVRALRRQEPVRPRLASHFEPLNGAPAPLPAGPPDVETTSFEQTPDASSTIRQDAPPPAPPHERNAPARELAAQPPVPASTRAGAIEGEAGRASSEPMFAAPAAPRGRESAAENRTHHSPADRAVGPPTPPRAPTETPRRIEVVRHEHRAAGAPEAEARVTEASAGTEARVRELEARVATLEAARAREKERRESLKPAPAAAVTPAARGAATPHTPAAAAPTAARGLESSDEPPHVTVTIGRVDVRAVFPAAAEAPRRAPAPRPAPTTLAQYLEKRERGRR